MALRKKERPLTPDELKEKLRKDTVERWLHSEPLFGLAPSPTGLQFFPLSVHAEKEIIILFLLDAGDFSTDRVLDVLDLWRTRYKKLPWKAVVAFQQKYIFLKNPQFFSRFRSHPCFSTLPMYSDPFGELFEKYGSSKEPVVAVFNQGNLVSSMPLNENFAQKALDLEVQLQQTLRQEDLGLPLPLLYPYTITVPVDLKSILPEEMTRSGYWVDSKTSLVTDDPNSTLSCTFEGKALRMITTLHPSARENCRIHVTLDGGPIRSQVKGEDIGAEEKGMSTMEIDRNSGIFEIIKSTDTVRGIIKFHFTSVIENPVIFYEMRIGT